MTCWLVRATLAISIGVACGCNSDTHEAMPDYGAPCSDTTPCPSGLACLPTSGATGYCTTTCDTAACPMGTTCNTLFGASVCFGSCTADASCHTGQQCWSGECQPACASDDECGGAGAHCTAGRCEGPECSATMPCASGMICSGGRCTLASDGGPLHLGDGAPCTRSADCTSGFCLPADRGGVCTVHCGTSDPCFAESFSSICGAATIDGAVGAFCLPFGSGAGVNGSACNADADCGNWTCIEGQCRDACTSMTQCLLGQMCTMVPFAAGSFMGCGYPPAMAGTEMRTVDLGTFTVAASSGTPDIVFATPPNTVSVTLRARWVSGDDLDLVFYRVFDSSGASIFNADQMGMYVDQPIRYYPGDSASATAMLIPNCTTDRYVYRPGRMRISVAAFAAPPATTGSVQMQVDALEVISPGPLPPGALHLRVHLVGVGVTAASAPSNARLQQFLSRFEQIIGQVGITVADVVYVDINAPALDVIDSAQGESSELAQLFRMSSGTTENLLNLFLVQNITAGGTGEFNTLGIAGGIPGPPRIQGSSHSGVVIAYDPGVVGPSGIVPGSVAAHEVGHFLGLFHTTENGRPCGAGEIPSMSDPCAPFGGTDVIGDTTYGNPNYLMNFAIASDASNTVLTQGEAFVELRNPLTR